MCETHVYTWAYPDGRWKKTRKPILCRNSRGSNKPCKFNAIFEHPTQYIPPPMAMPLFQPWAANSWSPTAPLSVAAAPTLPAYPLHWMAPRNSFGGAPPFQPYASPETLWRPEHDAFKKSQEARIRNQQSHIGSSPDTESPLHGTEVPGGPSVGQVPTRVPITKPDIPSPEARDELPARHREDTRQQDPEVVIDNPDQHQKDRKTRVEFVFDQPQSSSNASLLGSASPPEEREGKLGNDQWRKTEPRWHRRASRRAAKNAEGHLIEALKGLRLEAKQRDRKFGKRTREEIHWKEMRKTNQPATGSWAYQPQVCHSG